MNSDPPEYVAEPEYRVREGERNYRIDIMLSANPLPSIQQFFWFFNEAQLTNEIEGISFGIDYIIFSSVSQQNGGLYKTESSNQAGMGGVSFSLVVLPRERKLNIIILININ